MVAALELRKDYSAARLRRLARASKDGAQARRLLALAGIYAGGTRSEAAAAGGVTVQSIRDWAVRFNRLGPDGLFDRPKLGRRHKLNEDQRQALKEIVERGPIPAIDGVVRWRLIDLVQWLSDEFSVSLDETTVGRELKAMGYRKLTARPRHHAQNEYAVEAFKKTSPRKSRRSARGSSRG